CRGDGVEYHPSYIITFGTSGDVYDVWSWKDDYLSTGNLLSATWTPSYNAIYTYNTVLENLDNVIQTTEAKHKQVEGEALFGRAYFHFMLLVPYCLWDDEAPGIGYKDDTSPTSIPARETVKYTVDKILADLDNAEKLLAEAGRDQFEIARNFRPTVPAVKAFRARVYLYRGKYAEALKDAQDALAGYSVLHNPSTDPLYAITETNINLLNQGNTQVVGQIKYRIPAALIGKGVEALWKHPEFYTPGYSDTYYGYRTLPISQSYYDLFTDKNNDLRWDIYYNNNYIIYSAFAKTLILPGQSTATPLCFKWEDQQGLPVANRHAYIRFVFSSAISTKQYPLGTTTAEMYLIKAECLARAGKTSEAADALKTLRRSRFKTQAAADAIGGTLKDALDERAREMTELWRFFDIKRLNGADNANIKITRTVLTNPSDINSATTLVIEPNDPRWAIPINAQQLILMGWE
ncbi:MAG: RagB/SusD family nutrient uptake outer membrane protein, partial [Bacteroidales bacterium]|nr:RagB/SusD family nutrient uptake outer membrane protein [Bacteroidales bacterium]